ncbi:MAG: Asd/ArgC dimerization domain-containing protein, partial [Clostridia bacterium]
DEFTDNDYTKEEIKMINETKKILNLPNLKLTATCVRVPVINCHSESINIEFENEIDIEEIKKILNTTKGIKLIDDIQNNKYPINEIANGTDDIYVGRIRKDYSNENTINIWIVSDNIRKGAATNAVQILEKLIKKDK